MTFQVEDLSRLVFNFRDSYHVEVPFLACLSSLILQTQPTTSQDLLNHTTLLTMKLSNSLTVALVALFVSATSAFTGPSFGRSCSRSQVSLASTMADSGVPPTTSEDSSNVEDYEIPTKLPSDVGMDYIPLATMLATGQLAEADQVCEHCILVNLDRI
jgi:hypothetical protein